MGCLHIDGTRVAFLWCVSDGAAWLTPPTASPVYRKCRGWWHLKMPYQENVMNRFTTTQTAVLSALLFSVLAATAQAQSLRVRCETRADRSTASVDGMDVPTGAYTAVLMSGSGRVVSSTENTVANEVEIDFSSQRRDIRKGATAIPANFIVGGAVTAELHDAAGATVLTGKANCRVR